MRGRMSTNDRRDLHRSANKGGSPRRSNFDSDELLISAAAMCLAPASPMKLPTIENRKKDER